ncbi:MAG: uridine diphosphate-N-acetylglucosamine-binding protein YvcK [Armatimonadetes bacterium]|nr:uridine diphosphate-N-acetylglucosamine-binding protein YvcK [Armatimonadota bacterium]
MTKRRTSRIRLRRLFAPTAGLYRCVLAAIVGALLFGLGFIISFQTLLLPALESLAERWDGVLSQVASQDAADLANHVLGLLLLLAGTYLAFWGIRAFVRQMAEALDPRAKRGVLDVYGRKQMLARGPRIVALGGGTGLGTLLRGIKHHTSNITAVVTVTDDGGSSGRLVSEMGIIPPGDIRNCLVALADAEGRMTDLFQHRFTQASGPLSGHSIGNLLIAGFFEQTGDVDTALQMASEVLAIRGRVIPSTRDKVRLRAIMADDSEITGETAIVESSQRIRRIFLEPEKVMPHPDALEAIRNADLICIGPGSVFTSVIPNLLVPGIAEAVHDSPAIKAYICNVMTQHGESDAFTAAEHLVALDANIDQRVCDFVIMNTATPHADTIERYRASGQEVVEADVDRVSAMGYRPIIGDFMNETDFVRHEPARLAQKLIDLLYK